MSLRRYVFAMVGRAALAGIIIRICFNVGSNMDMTGNASQANIHIIARHYKASSSYLCAYVKIDINVCVCLPALSAFPHISTPAGRNSTYACIQILSSSSPPTLKTANLLVAVDSDRDGDDDAASSSYSRQTDM